jgi:hypothetical protein
VSDRPQDRPAVRAGVVAGALAGLVARDLRQRQPAIIRNFPVVGHLPLPAEGGRPRAGQYIVTSNDEERPHRDANLSRRRARLFDVGDLQDLSAPILRVPVRQPSRTRAYPPRFAGSARSDQPWRPSRARVRRSRADRHHATAPAARRDTGDLSGSTSLREAKLIRSRRLPKSACRESHINRHSWRDVVVGSVPFQSRLCSSKSPEMKFNYLRFHSLALEQSRRWAPALTHRPIAPAPPVKRSAHGPSDRLRPRGRLRARGQVTGRPRAACSSTSRSPARWTSRCPSRRCRCSSRSRTSRCGRRRPWRSWRRSRWP